MMVVVMSVGFLSRFRCFCTYGRDYACCEPISGEESTGSRFGLRVPGRALVRRGRDAGAAPSPVDGGAGVASIFIWRRLCNCSREPSVSATCCSHATMSAAISATLAETSFLFSHTLKRELSITFTQDHQGLGFCGELALVSAWMSPFLDNIWSVSLAAPYFRLARAQMGTDHHPRGRAVPIPASCRIHAI